MSFDTLRNPILAECRVDGSGNIGFSIPAPLLHRLKQEMKEPCISVKDVSLVSPPVPGVLGVEFHYPASILNFSVELESRLYTAKNICQEINKAFAEVVSGASLLDWEKEGEDSFDVRLKPGETLLSNSETLLHWLRDGKASEGWSVEAVSHTSAPDLIRSLTFTSLPTRLKGYSLFLEAGGIHKFGLVLPAFTEVDPIVMSSHPYNMFNSADPINKEFTMHLSASFARVVEKPRIFQRFTPFFRSKELIVPGHGITLGWDSQTIPPPGLEIKLRMNTFFQKYFLPTRRAPQTGVVLMPLTEVNSFRPMRWNPRVILLCEPYVKSGQAMFLGPYTLSTDLLGDNFLRPRGTLPCLALIRPKGQEFDLLHQPVLKLENVQGMSQQNHLDLLDAHGKRIPLGWDTRLWIEISSF